MKMYLNFYLHLHAYIPTCIVVSHHCDNVKCCCHCCYQFPSTTQIKKYDFEVESFAAYKIAWMNEPSPLALLPSTTNTTTTKRLKDNDRLSFISFRNFIIFVVFTNHDEFGFFLRILFCFRWIFGHNFIEIVYYKRQNLFYYDGGVCDCMKMKC